MAIFQDLIHPRTVIWERDLDRGDLEVHEPLRRERLTALARATAG